MTKQETPLYDAGEFLGGYMPYELPEYLFDPRYRLVSAIDLIMALAIKEGKTTREALTNTLRAFGQATFDMSLADSIRLELGAIKDLQGLSPQEVLEHNRIIRINEGWPVLPHDIR